MKNKEILGVIILMIIIPIIVLVLCSIKLHKNPYDVNRDGKVNSKDMLDLRNYLLNK